MSSLRQVYSPRKQMLGHQKNTGLSNQMTHKLAEIDQVP